MQAYSNQLRLPIWYNRIAKHAGQRPDPGPVERKLPPLAKVWTEDDVVQAAALYGEGLSLTAVAERLGSNYDTVAAKLRKAGVTIRPQSSPKLDDGDREQAKQLFRQGGSVSAIAQRFGVSYVTASRLLGRSMPAKYADRQAQHRQATAKRLADQEDAVLAVVQKQGRASRLDISRATGINYNTARLVVERLLGGGLIRRIGRGCATAYQVVRAD